MADQAPEPGSTQPEKELSSLAFLAEASAVLGASLAYETTLVRLAQLAVPRLADWCAVHLVDDDGSVRPVTTAHVDPAKVEFVESIQQRYPMDLEAEGGAAAVLRTGQTAYFAEVTDAMLVEGSRDAEHLRLLRTVGLHSVIIVPLTVRGRRLGLLSLGTERGRSASTDDLALAEELGRRAAVAVDNARLYRDMELAQAEARFQAALLRAQSEAGMEGLLVVAPTGEMISSNRRFADIWNFPAEVLAGASDEEALAWAAGQVVDPDAFMARVRRVYEHPDAPIRDEVALRNGTVLDRYGAPLHGDDGTYYGWAWYFRDVTVQKRTERALFESGERFATLARTLQESLLPPDLPDVRGVELATRYHPAGAGLDVGGDFYDVFQTGRNAWGIVVGDVCGKGAEAAKVTALARYTVRAASMQARSPSRILAMLNEAMLRQHASDGDRGHERFASVAYATLRRTKGVVAIELSSGGHLPPLLIRQKGSVEPVAVPGVLLGLFPNPDLVDERLELHPGDSLVFYTDGVTEARGPGGELGEEGLARVLASCGGMSAKTVAEAVETVVLDHQEGTAHDDIAVLVVHAT